MHSPLLRVACLLQRCTWRAPTATWASSPRCWMPTRCARGCGAVVGVSCVNGGGGGGRVALNSGAVGAGAPCASPRRQTPQAAAGACFCCMRTQNPEAKNSDGNTPLHWAALNGHAGVVRALLARGARAAVLNKCVGCFMGGLSCVSSPVSPPLLLPPSCRSPTPPPPPTWRRVHGMHVYTALQRWQVAAGRGVGARPRGRARGDPRV